MVQQRLVEADPWEAFVDACAAGTRGGDGVLLAHLAPEEVDVEIADKQARAESKTRQLRAGLGPVASDFLLAYLRGCRERGRPPNLDDARRDAKVSISPDQRRTAAEIVLAEAAMEHMLRRRQQIPPPRASAAPPSLAAFAANAGAGRGPVHFQRGLMRPTSGGVSRQQHHAHAAAPQRRPQTSGVHAKQ
jgi:hypothetical protein